VSDKAESGNRKAAGGLPLTAEQAVWWAGQQAAGPVSANPCVTAYGPGPDGKQCKTCTQLYAHRCSKVYYKCRLRNFTHGPGSDHKVRWPACAKYTEEKLA